MKVGLLADIHGNGPALTAALEAARAQGVERLLCCGDLVGYYYEPGRCLDLLGQWDVECVRGNHENMLSRLMKEPSLDDGFRQRFGSGLSVAARALTPRQLAYLAELPAQRTITIDGKTILLCHGAPWDTDEYVYPESGADTFCRCAESGADYVVMGHIHCQMAEQSGSTLLINPGSVGQPRRGTPGAEWALLDLDVGAYQHYTEPYDTGAVAARALSLDPHFPFLWEILERQ